MSSNFARKFIHWYQKYQSLIIIIKDISSDLLALNDFAEGAMENWGLVTFRDAMLLHDPDGSTTKSKEGISLVVCHEIAHQVSILFCFIFFYCNFEYCFLMVKNVFTLFHLIYFH